MSGSDEIDQLIAPRTLMKIFMLGCYTRSDVTPSEACQISANFIKRKFDRHPEQLRGGGSIDLCGWVDWNTFNRSSGSRSPGSFSHLQHRGPATAFSLPGNSANKAERHRRICPQQNRDAARVGFRYVILR
jgi:hypothetical protein